MRACAMCVICAMTITTGLPVAILTAAVINGVTTHCVFYRSRRRYRHRGRHHWWDHRVFDRPRRRYPHRDFPYRRGHRTCTVTILQIRPLDPLPRALAQPLALTAAPCTTQRAFISTVLLGHQHPYLFNVLVTLTFYGYHHRQRLPLGLCRWSLRACQAPAEPRKASRRIA